MFSTGGLNDSIEVIEADIDALKGKKSLSARDKEDLEEYEFCFCLLAHAVPSASIECHTGCSLSLCKMKSPLILALFLWLIDLVTLTIDSKQNNIVFLPFQPRQKK